MRIDLGGKNVTLHREGAKDAKAADFASFAPWR
jgi:hypothetical protein